MKIIIQASKEEKTAILIVGLSILILAYYINKRYFYVTDAVFDENKPVSIVFKTGFLFPVKTEVLMQNGWSQKIKIYGNTISVKNASTVDSSSAITVSVDDFDVFVNDKKVTTIYTDDYYASSKKFPTGRVKFI